MASTYGFLQGAGRSERLSLFVGGRRLQMVAETEKIRPLTVFRVGR